jgi:DNA-binding Lrp family transcriptional regulator
MQMNTSLEAYLSISDSGKLGARRADVLKAIVDGGPGTASEIAKRMDLPRDSVSPRLTELEELGWAVVTGARDCAITGYACIIWDKVPSFPTATPFTRKQSATELLVDTALPALLNNDPEARRDAYTFIKAELAKER